MTARHGGHGDINFTYEKSRKSPRERLLAYIGNYRVSDSQRSYLLANY